MNVVTEKYAQVLNHIGKAEKIIQELTQLLPDEAKDEDSVEKVADDFIGVAEKVATCLMVEAAMRVKTEG